MEFKLTGPTALVGLVALGMISGYRLVAMQTTLETQALEELKVYLAAEFAGDDVAQISERLQSGQRLTDAEARAASERIQAAQKISFPEVDARGMWKGRDGDSVVVKVRIEVDGDTPPDGDSIRYYRMRYRSLSGWSVGTRTSAWVYRLKFF